MTLHVLLDLAPARVSANRWDPRNGNSVPQAHRRTDLLHGSATTLLAAWAFVTRLRVGQKQPSKVLG